MAQLAALWYVATDMCDLMIDAAPKLPRSTRFHWDLLPDRAGMAVFEAPLSLDAEGYRRSGILPIALIEHLSGKAAVADYHDETGLELAEADMNDQPALMMWGPSPVTRPEEMGLNISLYGYQGDHLAPMGITFWQLGETIDFGTNAEATIVDRLRLMAMWLLSSQPGIATTTIEKPQDRATIRRQVRSGVEVPGVRVVHLRRRPTGGEEPAEQDGRIYKHRWMVSGHWRDQPYGPERSLRRPVYINPYLKGPEDTPLLTHETVKVWDQ